MTLQEIGGWNRRNLKNQTISLLFIHMALPQDWEKRSPIWFDVTKEPLKNWSISGLS